MIVIVGVLAALGLMLYLDAPAAAGDTWQLIRNASQVKWDQVMPNMPERVRDSGGAVSIMVMRKGATGAARGLVGVEVVQAKGDDMIGVVAKLPQTPLESWMPPVGTRIAFTKNDTVGLIS